jgi:hypothetical protein
MARQTFSANAGSTEGMRFTARDTVAIDTPARLATSRMLVAPGRRVLVGLLLGVLKVRELYAFPVFLDLDFLENSGASPLKSPIYEGTSPRGSAGT